MSKQSNINNKTTRATKWSVLTELVSKIISPVITMILARLLTPADFGVLATATMVISFAEIFTDAGFQKYIIQHEFKDQTECYEYTTIAFWSNLVMSFLIWGGISIFSERLAVLVGCPGRGNVIAISCVCIPISAFSSVQMALFKRKLDFRSLFHVRLAGVFLPVVVTIPLAFFTRNYWSLITGMISLNIANAILLTIRSPWKPHLYFSTEKFKKMLSFCIWSVVEAIAIWLTGYADIFIVGMLLNQYYLGIYRTAITISSQIMAIITSSTTPVLFASLSRLQNDDNKFREMYFQFQKYVGLVVIPAGVSIWLFRDPITAILLGTQWHEAAFLIGLWGASNSIVIVVSHYCSEVYRAKGKPKWSVVSQTLHLVMLIPAVLWASRYGFTFLCEIRTLVRFEGAIINLVMLYMLIHVNPLQIFKNIGPSLLAAAVMAAAVLVLPSTDSIMQQLTYAVLAASVYFMIVSCFNAERKAIRTIITTFYYTKFQKNT